MRRSLLILSGIVVGASFALATAASADYPERRIQLVYPWTPGTPTYAVSQIIADAMGEELGVQMPVVAKPGAGGVNAFMAALNEPADGYTALDGYVAPLIISPLFDKTEYTYESFIPLYSATSNAFAIATRADENRFTDFPSFIEYLKAHPGETRYTGGADLALPHMVAAKVLQHYDAVSRPVPYGDLADGTKDLRGGVLDWMVVNPGIYRSNTDHLRIIAVLSELPEVVEIYDGAQRVEDYGMELGLTGLAPMGWNWWLVKAGTPDDVVATLRDAMGKALEKPEVRDKILQIGFVPTGYTPDQYMEVAQSIHDQLQSATDAITWEKDAIKALDN
jgi:tripartite-type tricarboxylate transporter receptor subunit TctC